MLLYYIKVIDALGLLLLGFGFALILLPLTLYTKVADNWKNRESLTSVRVCLMVVASIIAMFVCGGVILILFAVWEQFFSPHPIMPKRLWNRTMVRCLVVGYTAADMCSGAALPSTSYTTFLVTSPVATLGLGSTSSSTSGRSVTTRSGRTRR